MDDIAIFVAPSTPSAAKEPPLLMNKDGACLILILLSIGKVDLTFVDDDDDDDDSVW